MDPSDGLDGRDKENDIRMMICSGTGRGKGTGHISFTTSGCSSNTHNTLVSGTIKFQTKHYKYSKEVEEVLE